MILVNQSAVEACWETLDKLARENVDIDKDEPALDINWPLFIRLQHERALMLVVARLDGRIIGFAMYYVMRHPHHQRVLIAQCDSLVVERDHRGKSVASRMIRGAEHILRNREVAYIIHDQKQVADITPLCAKLGYRLEAQSYRKVL